MSIFFSVCDQLQRSETVLGNKLGLPSLPLKFRHKLLHNLDSFSDGFERPLTMKWKPYLKLSDSGPRSARPTSDQASSDQYAHHSEWSGPATLHEQSNHSSYSTKSECANYGNNAAYAIGFDDCCAASCNCPRFVKLLKLKYSFDRLLKLFQIWRRTQQVAISLDLLSLLATQRSQRVKVSFWQRSKVSQSHTSL